MMSQDDMMEDMDIEDWYGTAENDNGNENVILVGSYVFCKRENVPSKGKVLRKLGLRKGSYMWNVVARFYDYFFGNLVNFNREYKQFYKHEFSSCAEFIEERYNIEKLDAKRYALENYWFKDLTESVERNVSNLNRDYRFANKFWMLIGGYCIESSDGLYY